MSNVTVELMVPRVVLFCDMRIGTMFLNEGNIYFKIEEQEEATFNAVCVKTGEGFDFESNTGISPTNFKIIEVGCN